MVEVHSDRTRKPRYWVTHEGKLLFKSNSASEAVQWAIDHFDDVTVCGEMELKAGENVTGRRKTIRERLAEDCLNRAYADNK